MKEARNQLAAANWNFHVSLEAATTKTGDVIVTRKYSQRTRKWNSKVVKFKKTYDCIPVLMAKGLRAQSEDADMVTCQVSLNESDAALLSPTTAATPAPPSTEFYLAKMSSFEPSNY